MAPLILLLFLLPFARGSDLPANCAQCADDAMRICLREPLGSEYTGLECPEKSTNNNKFVTPDRFCSAGEGSLVDVTARSTVPGDCSITWKVKNIRTLAPRPTLACPRSVVN